MNNGPNTREDYRKNIIGGTLKSIKFFPYIILVTDHLNLYKQNDPLINTYVTETKNGDNSFLERMYTSILLKNVTF